MLLVFWILLGKEFEHDLLLLVHAQSEEDGYKDEHADTEDTAHDCSAKCRKHNARIDGMAHIGIWASRHEFMMFFHRWMRTPITANVHARPNSKADTDRGKESASPAKDERWCKEGVRVEHCCWIASASADALALQQQCSSLTLSLHQL